MIFFRSLRLILLIITIIFFAYKAYDKPPENNSFIYRETISNELLNPTQNKEPPHYKFINKPVSWNGKLIGMTKKPNNTVKLNFWIDETKPYQTDTILITKIDNINEYFKANKNKFLMFKGKIVRIDVNNPGKEVVYVNGFISD